MNKTPTDEELDAASEFMKNRRRFLDEVCGAVLSKFLENAVLHDVWIFPEEERSFRAYIFFVSDHDVKAAKENSVQNQISDFIFVELERVGRGARDEINVAFEFDSHENIQKNFEGDYSLRMR